MFKWFMRRDGQTDVVRLEGSDSFQDGPPRPEAAASQRAELPVIDDGRETVMLPEVPQTFALYRSDSASNSPADVLGWILALPGGEVLMVRGVAGSREVIVSESLDQVETFWAPMAEQTWCT